MVLILMMRDSFDTFSSLVRLALLMIIGIFPMAGRNAEPGLSVCGAMLAPIDICICQRLVTLPMIIGIFPKAGLNAEPGLVI